MARVHKAAIRHYERRNEPVDTRSPGFDEFLQRITVNYIRHVLTHYDQAIEETAGRVGKMDAINLLRKRVYGAISEAYPDLAGECERQRRAHYQEGLLASNRYGQAPSP